MKNSLFFSVVSNAFLLGLYGFIILGNTKNIT